MESALEQKPFYHGTLSREETENLLRGTGDGTFLLRKSNRKTDGYVISVALGGESLHYSINPSTRDGRVMYSLNNGTPFPTPWEVCEHYMTIRGGLKVRLLAPMLKVDSNPSNSPYVMETTWYHNNITREEDSRRLSQGYRIHHSDGLFLVRKKDNDKYVLSLVNAGRVHRYMLHETPTTGQCYIAGKQQVFRSLEELITFHMQNPSKTTGLHCQLTIPCPKIFDQKRKVKIPSIQTPSATPVSNRSLVSSLASRLQSFLPENSLDIQWDPDKSQAAVPSKDKVKNKLVHIFQKTASRKWLDEFTKTSSKMPEECPGYNSVYQNFTGTGVARDLFIKDENISVYEQLGKGHFGAVSLGRCKIAGESTACAVKYLTGDDVMSNKKELLDEAALMQTLDHPNLIRLIAVCDTTSNLMMMLELAPLGPLRNFLKCQDESTFPEAKILNIMKQVCYGMEYLASKNIVHRDLAARNILLVSENFAKVSDFGMSKVLMESENYYRSSRPGSWPLRWYSPEALYYYKFTTKCDVWSYGVTLWEAFSYGNRPYRGMKGSEIMDMLSREERLDCPMYCSQDVYDLMLYCWTFDEEQRPEFWQLVRIIEMICQSGSNQPSTSSSWN